MKRQAPDSAGNWQRFWIAGGGGKYACAIVRIGIATSVLLTLSKLGVDDYADDLARRSARLYQPDGILKLLGADLPSADVLNFLREAALIATMLWLVGALTRVAHIASLVTSLALVSYHMSFSVGGPHQFNVVFLAQIAFLGARCGDVLSFDAWIDRHGPRRRPPRPPPASGYQWSIRLATFAVAWMYFNAFLHKIVMAGGTLRWAFSDNLRNHLLLRFDLTGLERTPLADWLMQSPWRYESAALLNLVSQAAPIVAVFLFRRPLWRAFFGIFFVIETIALAAVVDLWNLHWLPLAVVFVDWDRLWGWLRNRVGREAPAAQPESSTAVESEGARRLGLAPGVWLAVFVGITLIVGLVPRLDSKIQPYPFTRFPMFATLRAKKPYGVSRSYEFYGNHVEVVGGELNPRLRTWLDRAYSYRWLHRIRDPEELAHKLASLEEYLSRKKSGDFEALRVELIIHQAKAHPEPPALTPHRVGILGERERGGGMRALSGHFVGSDRRHIEIDGVGLEASAIEALWMIVDDDPEAIAIELAREGRVFALPAIDGEKSLLVLADVRVAAEVRRFVVARDPEIGW